MAKRKSKGIRHCIRGKKTRGGTRCAAYAPGPGLGIHQRPKRSYGDFDDFGHVARVITIPGKGVRCQDERGKFTSCLAGELSELGELSGVRGGVRRTARRTGRRVSQRGKASVTHRTLKLGEYISGKGYRCRKATGQFTRCR